MKMTKKKLTILIGAGAVIEPSIELGKRVDTNTITSEILKSAPNKSKKLLKTIYKDLCSGNKKYPEYKPTFEDLLHSLEILQGLYTKDISAPEYKPMYKYFTNIKSKYKKFNPYNDFPHKSFDDIGFALSLATEHVIKTIQANVEIYSDKNAIEWYKNFFINLSDNFSLDIFNLNYDTWLERIFKIYNDGFCNTQKDSQCLEFLPQKVLYSKYHININHLHGQLDFRILPHTENAEKLYNDYELSTLYKIKNIKKTKRLLLPSMSRRSTQAGEHLLPCSIITGKLKTEKIAHQPFDTYRTNFQNCIVKNPNLLIIGYGFNDYYINSLFKQFYKIHKNNKRVNIIDYYTKDDWENYHIAPFNLYLDKLHTIFGLCGDLGIQEISRNYRYAEHIPLDNNRFNLYFKGFKKTISENSKEIIASYNN